MNGWRMIAVCLLSASLCGCGATAPQPDITGGAGGTASPAAGGALPAEETPGDAVAEAPLRILFIGNSFTYRNDMPGMFAGLAEAAGYAAEVDSVFQGGCYFHDFTDSDNGLCRKIGELYEQAAYDVVFLQEQSVQPLNDREDFLENGALLAEQAALQGARVILYQTWPYEEGSRMLERVGYTYEEMYRGLQEAYRALAERTGAGVSPVGDAFYLASQQGEDALYDASDRYHPSERGSYLAACVHFVTAFDVPVTGNPFAGPLSADEAAALQRVADVCMGRESG